MIAFDQIAPRRRRQAETANLLRAYFCRVLRRSDSDPAEDPGVRPAGARRARRGPAMTDVAKLAGVSHQTVSRVVNGSDRVASETRERVLAAMRSLDYQPSAIARALKTGKSRTIGVISFATNLYGPASTLFAIERAAHEADYFTSIVALTEVNRASLSHAAER